MNEAMSDRFLMLALESDAATRLGHTPGIHRRQVTPGPMDPADVVEAGICRDCGQPAIGPYCDALGGK